MVSAAVLVTAITEKCGLSHSLSEMADRSEAQKLHASIASLSVALDVSSCCNTVKILSAMKH